MQSERKALRSGGKAELALRVKRISSEDVGAGYDVLSFDADGSENYVEVKAALGAIGTFEITSYEIAVAERLQEAYWLFWVSYLKSSPRIDKLQNPAARFGGDIALEPSAYLARLR